jgi:hypothetical protein
MQTPTSINQHASEAVKSMPNFVPFTTEQQRQNLFLYVLRHIRVSDRQE